MKALILFALLFLSACAPATVTLRMDILCAPVEPPFVSCADVQTWREYQARLRQQRMGF